MTGETLVIQPALPGYRRDFFERVSQDLPIHLICSAVSPEGVTSDAAGTTFRCDEVECVALPANLFWQKGVLSTLLRSRPAAIVVGGNPRYLSSVVAILLAKLRGARVVLWGHARSSTSGRSRTWLRSRLMYLADQILVYYAEEIPLLPERLRVKASGIGNSIDTEHIMSVASEVTDAELREFSATKALAEGPLLIMLGRLTTKARVDRVIRAIAILKEDGVAVKLAVIGDGPERDRLSALAYKLGIVDSVLWTGNISDESELALWMRSASLFVYGGAVGLSLVHAFAYGLPAFISSRQEDHNPEALLFVDGVYGASFNLENESSLPAVLSQHLEDPARLASMGDAAKRMVADRLGIERMAERFVATIANATRRSP